MHPSRIFDKPIGFYDVPPPLQLVGALPLHTPGEAYEGRLDIIDNIGDCIVEIIEANLPDGATARVDMPNLNVVLAWPPYSPPQEEKPGIINWDFQLETLEGWNDLRGNSWNNENSMVYGASWATPEDFVAAMRGVGRGDHVLESIQYPVTQGQAIMARSLWDQGPSNKDNNNLWTAFGLWRNGTFIREVRGDRIHDRTNKARHWSTVNHVVDAITTHVTVRLIAHRRNGRNRVIIADNVQTSGLSYTVGTDTDDDYFVHLKLTDSAGRVAYWRGPIFSESTFYVTNLYPLESRDAIGVIGRFEGARELLTPTPTDHIGVSGLFVGAELTTLVNYLSYTEWPPENIGVAGSFVGGQITVVVGYKTYSDGDPEDFAVQSKFVSGSLVVVANYISYNNYAHENIGVTGSFVGAALS